MYTGYSNLPAPVPVPVVVPARPIAASIPTPVLAAPHVASPPVPLPVPVSLPPPAPVLLSSPPYTTPAVPQVAAPAPVVPQPIYAFTSGSPALSIPTVPPPAPTAASAAPFTTLYGTSSSAATQAMPLPSMTAARTAPALWLPSSTSSPPPLTSAVSTPPLPLPVNAARTTATKTVTFVPAERTQAPAAAGPVITAPPSVGITGPTPLPSALRVPAPSVAPPIVPTLPVPAASTSIPAVPALRTVTPSLATANAHCMRTAVAPVTATPTVSSPLHATALVPAPHVPSVPASASLTVPFLPTPMAPPLSSSTAAVEGGSSLPSLEPAPGPLPTPQPLAVPALPVPAVIPPPLSTPLPTLCATEEEAPAIPALPPAVEEVELNIPDYSKWLYPTLLSSATVSSPHMKFPLAETKTPHVLPPPLLLQWCEADVLASLPLTLPPEYVIFGGARYSGSPLDLLRPPCVPRVPARKTGAYYESAETQRLQFLFDQLDVAKNYLKIEARRLAEVRNTALAPLPPPSVEPVPSASRNGEDVLVKPGEEEDLSKATVWTAAYFGSPQQLHRVLTSKSFDGMLSGAGYVQYRRRQWGLKRAGATFVLGLGMKATALQFAAAAGKLDNVVLLLASGAKDTAFPPLKEILLKESMAAIAAICAPRVRPPRATRHIPAEETNLQDTHFGPTPTFVKEQVVVIDDVVYAPAVAAPYGTATFS
ncbi:putative calphotin-like protein [Leptomonas seymouri]|uniref:Putative calphotin-like protein n=1 Tax=Leptomonas seymouri TaxID=5684 RepID=A0A0N0P802_LEPSE|nr:putative calphotin-like protein [Leptomonas seymouri]|eukprot:KPI89389.1 putative calphotin-like protein [Leptomonas seymouri]